MSASSGLTPRELEILQLVVAGCSNRDIALEISVCEKTVEFHLDRIYKKIGVHSRIRAALWAIKKGIGIRFVEIPK